MRQLFILFGLVYISWFSDFVLDDFMKDVIELLYMAAVYIQARKNKIRTISRKTLFTNINKFDILMIKITNNGVTLFKFQ